ncbi:MAG: hypothetical protein WC792_04540 [Candidatus Micrarchaeia archaeon]
MSLTDEVREASEKAAEEFLAEFFPRISGYHKHGTDLKNPFTEVKGTTGETLPLNLRQALELREISPDLLFAGVFLNKNTIALFFAKDAEKITNSSFTYSKLAESDYSLVVGENYYKEDVTKFFGKLAPDSVKSLLETGKGSGQLQIQPLNVSDRADPHHHEDKRKILDALEGLVPRHKIKIAYRTMRNWGDEGPFSLEEVRNNPGGLFVFAIGDNSGRIREYAAFFEQDAGPELFNPSSMGKYRGKKQKILFKTILAGPNKFPKVIYCETVGQLQHEIKKRSGQ